MTEINLTEKQLALWSIDPFEVETKPNRAALREFKLWLDELNLDVQPVHIFSLPKDHPNQALQTHVPSIKKMLFNYLNDAAISSVLEPKVVVEESSFQESSINALIHYAEKVNAQWIIVSSKGTSGLRRMALGSFAEGLILKSPVPIWIFGHGNETELNLKKILFSTDFSEPSRKAFNEVVQKASQLKAELVLFHKLTLPNTMIVANGLGSTSYLLVEDYIKDQREWVQKASEARLNDSQHAGVQTDFLLDEGIGYISDSILAHAARTQAGAIAMASQSGPISTLLLGSNARDVARRSHCPVWVYGSKWLRKNSSGS
jgi:nucleotide-binding universal stress UspA family protein